MNSIKICIDFWQHILMIIIHRNNNLQVRLICMGTRLQIQLCIFGIKISNDVAIFFILLSGEKLRFSWPFLMNLFVNMFLVSVLFVSLSLLVFLAPSIPVRSNFLSSFSKYISLLETTVLMFSPICLLD